MTAVLSNSTFTTNYTVAPFSSCHFLIKNNNPEKATEEEPEDVNSYGGFNFMFNEGLEILISNTEITDWNAENTNVEKYEVMTSNKVGQIYVPPASARRIVLINTDAKFKRIAVIVGGAFGLITG